MFRKLFWRLATALGMAPEELATCPMCQRVIAPGSEVIISVHPGGSSIFHADCYRAAIGVSLKRRPHTSVSAPETIN
jgi:hypothetical protein